MPEDLHAAWERVRRSVRGEVTDFVFHAYVFPLHPLALQVETLYLGAPGHIRTWVRERYLPLISAAVRQQFDGAAVEIVAEDWAPEALPEPSPPSNGSNGAGPLNPRYAFDQFVICDANRMAHAAALAVAENPGQAYNPLFIYGRPGLGKTHLLHAIGNYARRYGSGLSVRYVTVEEFTNEFVRAARARDTVAFKERFRGADVLLVDDIQFLGDKPRTKEEFFHTFNALYEAGRQLVITSDRPPSEIEHLEARLAERFEWGLVTDIEPPDLRARMAILEKRVSLDDLDGVPTATLGAIASRVTSSVRALEGALIRVVAYASLRGDSATPAHAAQVLARLYPASEPPQSPVERIQATTAASFGLTRAELLAADRRPRVALARQVAMFLARELTDESLPALGREFAGRNHSTILHAHRRISDRIGADAETQATVEALTRRLDSHDRPA